jgi:hypothetical protein
MRAQTQTPPPIVIVDIEDGYVANASSGCVTLTLDPASALTFRSETAALNYLLSHAPGVVAWTSCLRFCRCTSNAFLRALNRERPDAHNVPAVS